MSKVIDCRGLACPEPVIRVKNELKKFDGKNATVMVSSATARDNVVRIAGKMGWKAKVEADKEGFKLLMQK